MRVEKRRISGREKSEASIRQLEKLRERLFFGDPSARRCAAFKLSWMQEDGLDVLREILFRNDAPITARYAAGYGLRSMNGRMKKLAREVMAEGLRQSNAAVREVCSHTIRLFEDRVAGKPALQAQPRVARFAIRDIPRTRPRIKVSHQRPALVRQRVHVH
jgi:hypothetical protein